MGWVQRQDRLMQQLSPEVRRFVAHTLRGLEQENVFDAPGVIGGVLRRMRTADCDMVRQAAEPTAALLKRAFYGGEPRRLRA